MAVDQVAVIGLEKVGIKFPVLVPAHAAVQAVDGLSLRSHVKENLAGAGHQFQCLGGDLYLPALAGDLAQSFQGQMAAI